MIPKSPERSSDGSAVSSRHVAPHLRRERSGSDDDGGAFTFDGLRLPSAAALALAFALERDGRAHCERSRGSAAFCAECWETHSGSEESSSLLCEAVRASCAKMRCSAQIYCGLRRFFAARWPKGGTRQLSRQLATTNAISSSDCRSSTCSRTAASSACHV